MAERTEHIMKNLSIIILLTTLTIFSCKKKERESYVGTYTGTERYTHFDSYGDTLEDTTYSTTLTLELIDKKTYLVSKPTHPFAYEISSKELLDGGSVEESGFAPRRIWTVRVEENTVYGRFEDNNPWEDYNYHYEFNGVK